MFQRASEERQADGPSARRGHISRALRQRVDTTSSRQVAIIATRRPLLIY